MGAGGADVPGFWPGGWGTYGAGGALRADVPAAREVFWFGCAGKLLPDHPTPKVYNLPRSGNNRASRTAFPASSGETSASQTHRSLDEGKDLGNILPLLFLKLFV